MPKATMEKAKWRAELGATMRLILAIHKGVADAKVFRAVFGQSSVESLSEVAELFGVSANTVRSSWRANGMPGKPGCYKLADVLFWRFQHNAVIREKQSRDGNPFLEQQREAESRKAMAAALLTEKRLQDRRRNVASFAQVKAEVRILGKALTEHFEPLCEEMKTIFPGDQADALASEVRRKIQNAMVAFHSKTQALFDD